MPEGAAGAGSPGALVERHLSSRGSSVSSLGQSCPCEQGLVEVIGVS